MGEKRGQLDALLDVGLVLQTANAAPATGLAPGAFVGKYRLDHVLGEGGMGMVWHATDSELDRAVALKVLLAGTERARMVREARAMARLRHPNVITVFDAETIEGRDVIAMELVDGESFATWLARPHPLGERIAALLAAGRGLAAAHGAGLVHRDFKPGNVLVDRSGRVAVTDFGLARAIGEQPSSAGLPPETLAGDATLPDRPSALAVDPVHAVRTLGALDSPLTATGAVLGTPAYMAPEQHAGRAADERADQFAFCVAAWEAIAGARPFPGLTIGEIAASIERGVASHGERVPRRLRRVLARGLARDPSARWPNMDALLVAIERARRRPRRIALAASAAVVAVAAVTAFALTRHAPVWQPHIVDLPAFEENSDGPTFSPDGTQVAYASDRDGGGTYRIYVGAPDTLEPRAVTPSDGAFGSPRWTRDGSALLAWRWDDSTSAYRIARVPLAGGEPIDLGSGHAVDDCGDALAVADVGDGVTHLLLQRPDGSREVLVTAPREFIQRPRCDRDGQHIVYMRGSVHLPDRAGNDLFVVDRHGHEVQLTHDHASVSGAFSADGRSIVFSHIDGEKMQLFEIAATGGKPRALTAADRRYFEADVSRDGKRLLFDDDVTSQVVVVGGSVTPHKLTARREVFVSIELTPDGATLVASRLAESGPVVATIATSDGAERTLAAGGYPFASADSKRVLFVRAHELVEIPIGGGEVTKICDLPAPLLAGSEGSDGVIHLALQRDGGEDYWRFARGGTLEREDSGGIVFAAPRGNARVIVKHANGVYHFKVGDADFPSEWAQPTWLDERSFAFGWRGKFYLVDAVAGTQFGTVPGPESAGIALLGPDARRWYQLQSVGHITRHVIDNFAER